MAPKFLTRSFGIAAISLLVILGGVAPAAASDLDLGQPATMDDLLASPEYRYEHADVLRLYLAFLDRQPGVAGAAYWIYENENGVSEDDLAWGFSQSEEFATLVSYDDVDPTLQGYTISGPIYASFDEPALVARLRPLVLPDDASGTFYIQDVELADLTKSVIENDVYGFSDQLRASAMVAEIKRSFTAECASFTDQYGGIQADRVQSRLEALISN